jgi:serine phosphatase RsbU (regulator of sigma subunit)/anti-sigma regulatory factor (Ser/Thr protein kinase)
MTSTLTSMVDGQAVRVFPAVAESLQGIRCFVTETTTVAGIDDQDISVIMLAVHEAAANAIEHSGGTSVMVGLEFRDDLRQAIVRDDGVFSMRTRQTDARGRGLDLLTALTDSVHVRQGRPDRPGTIVRLCFPITLPLLPEPSAPAHDTGCGPMWTQPARQVVEEQARHTSLFQQLAVALASTIDTTEVARVVTVTVTGSLRADASSIIRIDHSGTCQLLAAGGVPAERLAGWSSFDLASYPAVVELIRARRPILVTADEWSRRFPASALLDRLCSIWAVLPLVTNDEPVGMAAFGWFEEKQFAAQELDLLLSVAAQTAIAMERARLFEAERHATANALRAQANALRAQAEALRAQQRLTLLAEASARLAASITERQQLTCLAELLIEGFCDTCAVIMPDEEGRLRRTVIRTARQAFAAHLATLIETPIPTDNERDCRLAAWRHGRITREIIPDISRHIGAVPAAEGAAMAVIAGPSVSIAVPLIARGRIIGVFNIWRNHTDSPVNDEDERFLADLGRRAGIAVDNARLLAAQTHVATRLQETLLPAELPVIPGIELTARYLVAEDTADVGGDLYDAFLVDQAQWTSDPSYALIIGDVSGRGVDAAGLTGLARATLRALAPELAVPAALSRLNTLLAERSLDNRFLTLAYLLLSPRPDGADVSVWLAGHPHPVLIHADGTVVELGQPCPLLGVYNEITVVESRYRLVPGDLLLLYTDGLTEASGEDGLFGEARLPALLADLGGASAATAVERIEREVLDYRRGRSDDVAFLVVRVAPAVD